MKLTRVQQTGVKPRRAAWCFERAVSRDETRTITRKPFASKNLGRDDLSRLGLFRKEWESRDWVHRGNTANDRESGQRIADRFEVPVQVRFKSEASASAIAEDVQAV